MYHEPLGVYVDFLVMLESHAANFLRFVRSTDSFQLFDIWGLIQNVCHNITQHGAIWNPSSNDGFHEADLEWLLWPIDEPNMRTPRDTSQDIDLFHFCSEAGTAAMDATSARSSLSAKARIDSTGDPIDLLKSLADYVYKDILKAQETRLSKSPQPTDPVDRRIESGGIPTRGPEEPVTTRAVQNKTRRRDLSTMPAAHLNETKAIRNLYFLLRSPKSLSRGANQKAVSASKAAKPANILSVVLNSLRWVPAEPSLPPIDTDALSQATYNVSRDLEETLRLRSDTQKVLACERTFREAVRRLLESIKAPDLKDRSAMVKTGEWVVKRKKSERASIGRSRALRECEDLSMKEHYPDHLSHQDVLDELQEWDEAAGEEEVEQDTFQLFVPDPSQVFTFFKSYRRNKPI
ncbi:hypothetical protein NW755_011517 [Fusarium falciforme]|uniref:Uncharacterized protein n=1 Tax=Fusarium falciforme TaxID=195108 RepID=A0A9W8QX11_9HYPO|nr:hypothetical protein NW755_011517 [Fusarium falciforme]